MADNELATSEHRREFVKSNHTLIVGYGRKTAGPSMSIVHYVMDGDKICFLTMSERQKAKAIRRGVPLSLCILAGETGGLSWPPEYLVVDGQAEIITDMDYIIDNVAFGVGEVMRGTPIPEEARPGARPMVEDMMRRENRVAIQFTPESTFHSPSVHPDPDDPEAAKKMVHGLGARLPW